MSEFRSHGKFLLTGEYLVLKGALALALPLKFGQSMSVKTMPISNNLVHWDAYTPRGFWFSAMIDKTDFTVKASDDLEKAEVISKIFKTIKKLNSNILNDMRDYSFSTRLEFDRNWGLGSSSTLISNLAEWAGVDPYSILKDTFGGSGYDIACAKAKQPIFYQLIENKPVAKEIEFKPDFADKLYFVYQGHKQNSAKEVGIFKKRLETYNFKKEIDDISEITLNISKTNNYACFCKLLSEHEDIISNCIGQKPLQTQFPDFQGTIKSLGAWGGDFLLAASELPFNEIGKYFKDKGLTVIFKYKDIVF